MEIQGKVAVVNAQGRTFMKMILDNPFETILPVIEEIRRETNVIFVDMHAETTSEKSALAWMLDGRVSAVVGTHTHVQTADERILPDGTAFLTDAGMCGPLNSVIGMDVQAALDRLTTLLPGKNYVAQGPVKVCGALVEVNAATGKAVHIERVQRMWNE